MQIRFIINTDLKRLLLSNRVEEGKRGAKSEGEARRGQIDATERRNK
jgi:hypothetical protein